MDGADEGFYRDDDPSGPETYVPLLRAQDEEELMAVRSVLADAGIPFVVKGEEVVQGGVAGSGRVFSSGRSVTGPFRIDIPEGDREGAREVLMAGVYRPVSELRAKALEMKFLSGIIWSAVWSLSGFAIAFFSVPDDWDHEVKLFAYILAGLTALIPGNAIKRSMERSKDIGCGPWLDE